VALGSATLLWLAIPGCKSLTDASSSAGAQKWDLVNDAGDIATVVVTPFTNSGTFSETSGNAHWWMRYPGGQMQIPVSGTVSHTSQGDHWYFTFSIQDGGVSLQGHGEGYSDGNFPNAVTAEGTTTGVATAPGMGSQTVTGSWRGYLNNN